MGVSADRFEPVFGAGRGTNREAPRWRDAEEQWWTLKPNDYAWLSIALGRAAARGFDKVGVREPPYGATSIEIEGPLGARDVIEVDGGGQMWLLDRWPEELRFPIEPGSDWERGFLTYAAARAAGHL